MREAFALTASFFSALAIMLLSMQSEGTQHLINVVQVGPVPTLGKAMALSAIIAVAVYQLLKPRRVRA